MSDESAALYRNDTWSLGDGFGLGAAGDQVARMALEVDPPFTIGVTGKWGSGKTSVMRRAFVTLGGRPIEQPLMFKESVSEEETDGAWKTWAHDNPDRAPGLQWPPATHAVAARVLCIWYSPWQHQNENNPLVPLIREIQAQFTAWYQFKGSAKAFNRQAGLAAAKLLEHLADAAASLYFERPMQLARGLTDAVRSGWQAGEDRLTALSDGQRFHLLFQDAVEQVLKSRGETDELKVGARLLVFVDDLDRCEGEVIVRLLEIIKLYLGTRRCVFVLGLDDSAVLDALRKHRSESDEGNRDYLEKLFQANLGVPLPSQTCVRGRIAAQLVLHEIPRAPSGNPRTQGQTDAGRARLAADIERLLEPNPRKVKNFLNSLCAAWAMHGCNDWIAGDAQFEVEARRFVLLQYLRHSHRPIWRLLERQPETIRHLWAVLTGAKTGTEPGGDTATLDDTGLLKEIFFRAFSHTLRTPDPDDHARHGNESLDEAVRSAIERRDRKRSDDNFRILFTELFEYGRTIDPRHIFLRVDEPAAVTAGPADEDLIAPPDTDPNR